MGYSAKAASIRKSAQKLQEYTDRINQISLGSVWNGENYNNINEKISNISTNVSAAIGNLNSYAGGLDKLQKYKDNDQKIKNINSQIQMIRSKINKNTKPWDASTYYGQIASLNYELNELVKENETLEGEIKNAMAAAGGVSSSASSSASLFASETGIYIDNMIETYSTNELDYLYSLVDKYANGKLKSTSLYNGVDPQFVEDGLNYIKGKYSQRDAAIYSGMFIMSMAADNGIKIPYHMDPKVDNSPYISTQTLVDGADCEVVTDWVVDKGRTDGFTWKIQNNYKNVGEPVIAEENAQNWTSVLPGDLFVNSGHVGVILGNDLNNRTFICMEATMGDHHAVAVTTRTYEEMLAENYQIQNMSSVYASSNDEYSIPNYEQYTSNNN